MQDFFYLQYVFINQRKCLNAPRGCTPAHTLRWSRLSPQARRRRFWGLWGHQNMIYIVYYIYIYYIYIYIIYIYIIYIYIYIYVLCNYSTYITGLVGLREQETTVFTAFLTWVCWSGGLKRCINIVPIDSPGGGFPIGKTKIHNCEMDQQEMVEIGISSHC